MKAYSALKHYHAEQGVAHFHVASLQTSDNCSPAWHVARPSLEHSFLLWKINQRAFSLLVNGLKRREGRMIDRFRERVEWIERHVLPNELRIRAWLNKNQVTGPEADDLIQEMYARIGSMENFEEIHNPLLYGIKVVQSILLNQVRRSRIVSISNVADLDSYEFPSPDASPEEELSYREEVQQVAKALATLPKRTRDVLLLRRVDGLSQRETAKRLAIAEKTVEKHLARAALFLAIQFGRGGKVRTQTSLETGEHSSGDDETSG